MSILSQVEDAKFLRDNGRYLGSLSILMLAIAASAKRKYPEGTQSIRTPLDKNGGWQKMLDGESFELFLGRELKRIINDPINPPATDSSSFSLPYNGQQTTIERILYKFYRCALVHEGQLQDDIKFVAQKLPNMGGLTVLNTANPVNPYVSPYYTASIGLDTQGAVVMTYGWLDIFTQAVTEASVNEDIFGLHIPYLLPIDATLDEQTFRDELYPLLGLEPCPDGSLPISSFFNIMKLIIRGIGPERIRGANNGQIQQLFQTDGSHFSGADGAFTGIRNDGLLTDNYQLTAKGLQIIRFMAEKYELR